MSKITSAMAVLGVVAGLGVAALPLSSYAAEQRAESEQVTVRATVNSALAVSTDGVDLVDFGNIFKGSGEKIQTIAVTVSGSVATYNLGVMDYDDDNNMVNTSDDTKTIPAITGNVLESGWGFRNESRHESKNAWAEVPVYSTAASTNLEDGATLDATNGSTTNVQFGINIDGISPVVADGVYEDKVIFVATATTE